MRADVAQARWLLKFGLSPISLQCCERRGESERRAVKERIHLSGEGLIIILVVGVIAGWLAGKVVSGQRFRSSVGDVAIGIAGALIGDWLLHRLGVHFGSGIIGLTINATIGAIVLLLALRLIGASGWGSRWSQRDALFVVAAHVERLSGAVLA